MSKLLTCASAFTLLWWLSSPLLAKGQKAPPPGKAAEAAPNNPADSFLTSSDYVNHWIPLPEIKGLSLDKEEVTLKPQPGQVEVLVFIATSCIPCQHLMQGMKEIEDIYSKRNARFTYIFSHDTLDDAKEFGRVHGLTQALLARHELLAAYHDPVVPCVYVGDRHGWLLTRFPKINPRKLDELASLLHHLTVL